MAPSRYTPEQRSEAVRLYQSSGPTAVEKQLGIPKNTVMRWAKKAGVRTVRNEATRNAVEAKVVDGKLRRANIADRLYSQVEKMLDDLEAPKFQMILKASFGEEKPKTLNFIPANEKKTLVQACGSALVSVAKLEAMDVDKDMGEVGSVVDDLRAAFKHIAEAGQ